MNISIRPTRIPQLWGTPIGRLLFSRLLLSAVFAVCVFATPKTHAQAPVFSAQVTINLDPLAFNLESLSPTPGNNLYGGVFAGGTVNTMPITIKQWTDGSITVATSSRVESFDQQTGQTTANTVSATGNFTIGANAQFESSGSSSVTQSSSVSSEIRNSLTYRVEGNLLIAVVEYTADGVKYKTEISLGEITRDGGFTPFTTGFLAGKSVVSIPDSFVPDSTVSPTSPPAKTTAGGRGTATNSGTPITANVLVGYWVQVARVNGVVVSVLVEAVYEQRVVGFAPYYNPYNSPGGGNLQF